MARIYQHEFKHKEAINALNRALAIKPGNIDLLMRAGRLYAVLGEIDQVVVYYERASALDPGNHNLAADLKRYREIVRDEREYKANYEKGINAKRAGKPEEAVSAFKKALEIDSESTGARMQLAMLQYDMGRFNQALENFKRVFSIDKTAYNACYYAAKIYIRNHQPDMARKLLLKIVADNSGSAISVTARRELDGLDHNDSDNEIQGIRPE